MTYKIETASPEKQTRKKTLNQAFIIDEHMLLLTAE
jgi:hypothetical protein